MNSSVARDIAQDCHGKQRTRFGDRVVDHLARVAAAVPPDARVTAWLHDLLEKSDRSPRELRADGLSRAELAAVELLTRRPSEPYVSYALRISDAGGEAGRLARLVKLADLDDHLAHTPIPAGAPPYAWAQRRIASSQVRHGERRPSGR
jgi:hypothetical protein